MWTRRQFLKTASVSMAALLAPPALLRSARARASASDPVLVLLFQRGAADGLNLVAPHGDPYYLQLRPSIGLPTASLLELDGFFGLHPSLAPLLPFFQSGDLAIIHAAGTPDASRSHFDTQDFVEYGTADKTITEGWLNRYLAAAGLSSSFAAITLAPRPVKSLVGGVPTLAFSSLASLQLIGTFQTQESQAITAIQGASGGLLADAAALAFSTEQVLRSVNTSTSVSYPGTPLASALRDLAALIKADIGVRVVAIDSGGWDHHGDIDRLLPISASTLAQALAAFATDLGGDLDRTLLMTVTEFGRRAQENGGGGADHGHGGVMFALGGGIHGGRVMLRDQIWPGLGPQQLFESIDLAVTTDVRDAFSEALDRHMGLSNLGAIFPAYTPDATLYPGLYT